MQVLSREPRIGPEKVASDTGSVNLTLVTPVATKKQLALYRAAEARRSANVLNEERQQRHAWATKRFRQQR